MQARRMPVTLLTLYCSGQDRRPGCCSPLQMAPDSVLTPAYLELHSINLDRIPICMHCLKVQKAEAITQCYCVIM